MHPCSVFEETRGSEIIDQVGPLPDEVIIKRYRHSAFVGTGMDILLRSSGIKTEIVTGFTTERCVLVTITGAIANDYYVVVRRDCVAGPYVEMHQAALRGQQVTFVKKR